MPFNIVLEDISTMSTDCIVNATNSSLIYGGYGVDYAIHTAAGSELEDECALVAPCPVGEVRVTRGYKLKCKYIIHTVGPVWKGKNEKDTELLKSCYNNALQACLDYGCESIAMPMISSGNHGFPNALVLKIAADTSREFLKEHDLDIYLVVYSRRMIEPDTHLSHAAKRCFSEESSHKRPQYSYYKSDREEPKYNYSREEYADSECVHYESGNIGSLMTPGSSNVNDSSDEASDHLRPPSGISGDYHYQEFPDSRDGIEVDESFGQTVTRLAEQYYTPSQFYSKANISKQIYSKMKTDPKYNPSRSTALACAIVLKEKGIDMNELLSRAGMALSPSDKRDRIIRIALDRHIYDIIEINCTLFEYDLALLGSV